MGIAADKGTGEIFLEAFYALIHPDEWVLESIIFSLLTLLLVFGGRRIHPAFPGILLAVIIGIIATQVMPVEQVLGEIQIPPFTPPQLHLLSWTSMAAILTPALVIALIGFSEVAAISRTMSAKTRTPWDANREFISQGIANIMSGLGGGMPVGGSLTRTLLNYTVGGRTRWSGLIAGLTVLLLLPFISLMESLPMAVLAAIVISTVVKLVDFKTIIELIRLSRAQAAVAVITFFSTLIFAPRVDIGIIIGIILSIIIHLWRERRIKIRHGFRKGVLVLEPIGVLYFGSGPELENTLINALAKYPEATRLIIDLRKVGRIDYSGVVVLRRMIEQAEENGMEVKVVPGSPPQGERLINLIFKSHVLTEEKGVDKLTGPVNNSV